MNKKMNRSVRRKIMQYLHIDEELSTFKQNKYEFLQVQNSGTSELCSGD